MTNTELAARYEGVQTFLKDGCLFLSLSSIIEEVADTKVDILDAVKYCKKMGYIDSNGDMSLGGQCQYLRDLTGKNWTRDVKKELPAVVPDEMYTVEKWENARTGYTHFKRRFMDTLVSSTTVKEGIRVAYYCYSHD